jgi:hypothetical protein
MVVFDSTFLLLLVHENVRIPADPKTRRPWDRGRDRVEHLLDRLSDARVEILIPTPVLAETLVRTGPATAEYLTRIRAIPGFRIGNFDQKAAVELALMTGLALDSGKKRGVSVAPWQKVKIDRQIVAIAKSEGVTDLYSCDVDLCALARAEGMTPYDIGDLLLPPVKAQPDLFEPDDRSPRRK